jgi:hypothetical protein
VECTGSSAILLLGRLLKIFRLSLIAMDYDPSLEISNTARLIARAADIPEFAVQDGAREGGESCIKNAKSTL